MSDNPDFFNLNDKDQGLHRRLAEGLTTRIFAGEHAMLSIVSFEPNARGEVHSHPEEQWGVLLSGDGVRVQGERRVKVRPGDFWRTPSGAPHTFIAGDKGAQVLDIFAPPRNEYRKPGSGFGAE